MERPYDRVCTTCFFAWGCRPHVLFSSQERLFDTVTIALVGKYTDLKDSYMSVTKALEHSAFRVHRKLIVQVSSFFGTTLIGL